MDRELLGAIDSNGDEELFQASMGIYVFNRKVLIECLENDLFDFGNHVIPQSIKDRHVNAFIFKGYWEDIGTIRAFYEANLDLTDVVPEYSFFEPDLPSIRIRGSCRAAKSTEPRCDRRSFPMDASFRMRTWNDASLGFAASFRVARRSVTASLWARIILNSVLTDSWQPAMGIGQNCVIDRAIIDKNARIGDGVVITPEGKSPNFDGDNYFIRDGIIVVPKNAVIPAGFWI